MSEQNSITKNGLSTSLFINCKQATKMIVVSEVEKLSFTQRIALWYHLFICNVCALFQKQSVDINNVIKKNELEKTYSLSFDKKEELSKLLNEMK